MSFPSFNYSLLFVVFWSHIGKFSVIEVILRIEIYGALQWLYGSGICHEWLLVSKDGCFQFRHVGVGDCEREEKYWPAFEWREDRPFELRKLRYSNMLIYFKFSEWCSQYIWRYFSLVCFPLESNFMQALQQLSYISNELTHASWINANFWWYQCNFSLGMRQCHLFFRLCPYNFKTVTGDGNGCLKLEFVSQTSKKLNGLHYMKQDDTWHIIKHLVEFPIHTCKTLFFFAHEIMLVCVNYSFHLRPLGYNDICMYGARLL